VVVFCYVSIHCGLIILRCGIVANEQQYPLIVVSVKCVIQFSLMADTHSRTTRAVLDGRVVRPCNTGAIRVTLLTHVTPVLYGRVIRPVSTSVTWLCVSGTVFVNFSA